MARRCRCKRSGLAAAWNCPKKSCFAADSFGSELYVIGSSVGEVEVMRAESSEQDAMLRWFNQDHPCKNQATHEYAGGKSEPVKRRRAKKHKCRTVLFGRMLLSDECCKSVWRWLGVLDPPQ